MRRGLKLGGTVVFAVLALSAPTAFAAGGATGQGYPPATAPPAAGGSAGAGTGNAAGTSNTGTPSNGVLGVSKTQGAAAGGGTLGRATGTLPFTGVQLGLVVLLGLLLVGGGVVLRTSGRRSQL